MYIFDHSGTLKGTSIAITNRSEIVGNKVLILIL